MSAGDRPNMHEQTGCCDPNTMAEGVSSLKDSFPQTLPEPSPPPLMVAGNTTDSNNNSLEENLRLSVEELSYLDMGVLEFNRVTASVGKGREGKATTLFAAEKQRREQLNEKYKILRSLIPNPNKIDRASVVGDAIDYIRELIRTVNKLKLLMEKKRHGKERRKRHKTKYAAANSCNIKPFGDSDRCIRTSWLHRKSKDNEVDVRIIDDDVTIKVFIRKKINYNKPNFTLGMELKVWSTHKHIVYMLQNIDAFIAIPGGLETLEAVIVSLANTNFHQKPLELSNVNGFFDVLLSFLDRAVEQGFSPQVTRRLMIPASNVDQLIDQLQGLCTRT